MTSARTRALAAALLVGAAALRVWASTGDRALLDGDEAVVGIQALRIAHGDLQTFFLGQPYGGTLEAFLAAAPVRLSGAATWALRLGPFVCTVVAAVLLHRLARRLHGPTAATLSAAVLLAWPPVYVWFGMHAASFYASSLALGVATCLLLVTIADDRRWQWYALLGLVVGLAWWQAPYIVYFALPGLGWLALHRHWAALVRLPMALPTAAVGALPWLAANVGHGFPSLDTQYYESGGTYLGKLWYVGHTGLAIATGFKAPYSTELPGGVVVHAAYVALAVALVVAVVIGVRHRRLWALGLAVFPFVYALNPLPPTSAHGRYFFFLSPWLALLAGEVASRSTRWLAGVAAVLAGTTVVGVIGMNRVPWEIPYREATGPVTELLASRDVDRVFAEYFTAYKLVYETNEGVLATPFVGVRDVATDQRVRAATTVAYVFPTTLPGVPEDVALFDELGVATDQVTVDGYVVVFPARPVLPEELGPALLVP